MGTPAFAFKNGHGDNDYSGEEAEDYDEGWEDGYDF